MKSSTRNVIILGAVCFIAGIVAFFITPVPKAVSHTLVNVGIITLVYSLIKYYKKDALICDERSMHIVMYSLAYSWFATFGIVMALVWINLSHWLTLAMPIILGIIALFMVLSGIFFYLYLSNRGKAE